MGASNWLTVNRYDKNENNTLDCIQSLKNKGYRIVATSPHNSQTDLINFDLSKGKTALFFGTELEGLSDVVLESADEYLHIPMYGFTESFNLSVSAAICLYEMRMKMEKENIKWHMTEDEKNQVLLIGYAVALNRSEIVEEDFEESFGAKRLIVQFLPSLLYKKSIVQTTSSSLPKFNFIRYNGIASPIFWSRYFIRVFLF